MSDESATGETVCCGFRRRSRFCPDCGKLLRRHGLDTLLRHCEMTLASAEKRVEMTHPDHRLTGRRKEDCEKWRVWVAHLRKVLADRFGGDEG